jgi:hypothetical protein
MHETASAKRDKGDFVPSATLTTLKSSFYSMSLVRPLSLCDVPVSLQPSLLTDRLVHVISKGREVHILFCNGE